MWFDDKAEEAAAFYTSIFKNSKITTIVRYGDSGAEVAGRPKGTVMTVAFDGQEFVALNGGPQYKFAEAVSFVVNCQTQEEVDGYWKKLKDGGQEVQCGWLVSVSALLSSWYPRHPGLSSTRRFNLSTEN